MAVAKPQRGDQNWDVSLNAKLDDLDLTVPGSANALAASGTYVSFGQQVIDLSTYAGYDASGATDSTNAINTAIAAGLASGVREFLVRGTPITSGITLPAATANGKGLTFRGFGKYRSSALQLVGGTTLFANGVDDGLAYDANDYTGPEGLTISNLRLLVKNPTTLLDNGWGNYTPGTYGIRDWRGGSIILDNVVFDGFDFPFWGISSDLDVWSNVEVNHAHSGCYFGPRCDQLTFRDHVIFNYCDRALDLDSLQQATLTGGHFYACGVPMTGSVFTDWVTTNGSPNVSSATAAFTAADKGKTVTGPGIQDQTVIKTVTDASNVVLSQNATATSAAATLTLFRSGGQSAVKVRSAYPRGAARISLLDCHFEDTFKPDGVSLAVYESYVSVGTGGADVAKAVNVNIVRPDVYTAQIAAGHHTQYLVKVDNADAVTVEDYGGSSWFNLDGMMLLTGATPAGKHLVMGKAPVTTTPGSAERTAVKVFDASSVVGGAVAPRSVRKVYGHNQSVAAPGAYEGWMIGDTQMIRVVTDTLNVAAQLQVVDFVGGTFFQMNLGAGSSAGSRYAQFTMPGGGTMLLGASGDKLGFFGAAGSAKPTGTPAAATDLASAIALVNSLRTALLTNLGLVG